jgi:hypothetical protein
MSFTIITTEQIWIIEYELHLENVYLLVTKYETTTPLQR